MPRPPIPLLLALVLACSGSQRSEPVLQVLAPEAAADAMLLAIAEHEICDSLRGSFQPLGGRGGEADDGVLLVERCTSERDDHQLSVRASGRGWRWLDRRASKLGAEFGVSQHVRFAASIAVSGRVEYGWAPDERVLSVWFRTVGPFHADVELIGPVKATEEDAWAEVLGALADVAGDSPDERAASEIEGKAESRFEGALEPGYTVAVDLCTRQVHGELGILPRGELPKVPVAPRGHRFEENTSIAVHPGAPIVTGPFERSSVPLRIRHQVDGGSAELGAYCMKDARQLAEATLTGKGSRPAPRALHTAGPEDGELTIDTSACPTALAWSLPEGSRSSVTVRYLAWRPGKRAKPLVDCRR